MSKLVVYNVYSMSHFKAKINMLTHADGPSEKSDPYTSWFVSTGPDVTQEESY